MNNREDSLANPLSENMDKLTVDKMNAEDNQYLTCSNLENQMKTDFSRITNDTAPKLDYYLTHKSHNSQRLTYVAAACGASFLRFSRRSTMHGLNHLAQARTAGRRSYWFIISVIALIGFSINMYFIIDKYQQIPVLTNVLHDSENFIYPDVTFCNINPMYYPPEGTPEYFSMINVLKEYEEFKKSNRTHSRSLKLADYLFVYRRFNFYHPSWITIARCTYMKTPCSHEHFEVKFIWPYGACFTFNVTKMKGNLTREIISRNTVSRFRPDFQIVVYKALNMPTKYQQDPHGGLLPSGILLMIHEPDTYPHIGLSNIVDGCTQIELKMTMVKHLEKLGKCTRDGEIISYVNAATNESQVYLSSHTDCLDATVQANLAEFCKCQMHSMPIMYKYRNLPYCQLDIFNETYINKCATEAKKNIKEDNCLRDVCEHYTIDRVIAHTKFPAIEERLNHLSWLNLLADMERREKQRFNGKSDLAKFALNVDFKKHPNMTIADALRRRNASLLNIPFVNKNFMMLRIAPVSFFMDRVEETEEYPFSRLLSDIGGCVGLWIGASLITICELADLILDFIDMNNIGFPNIDQFPAHERRRPLPNFNISNEKMADLCETGNLLTSNRSIQTLSELSTHEDPPLIHQANFPNRTPADQSPSSPNNGCNATRIKMIPIFYLPSQFTQGQNQSSPSKNIVN